MEIKPRKTVKFCLNCGKCPFDEWFEGLKDKKFKQVVDARLARIRNGNFGDHKNLGNGIFELRINIGGGLRVYYGIDGKELVILLAGGIKRSQNRDINNAKNYWKEYLDETKRL